MRFVFNIEPVQQARPRARRLNRTIILYDPAKVKKFKLEIERLAKEQMFDNNWERLEDTPIWIDVWFYRAIQKSISKKEHERRANGESLPIVKPDTDNLIKSCLDGLNGTVWKDDALITDIHAHKRYSDNPRIEVTIQDIGDNGNGRNMERN